MAASIYWTLVDRSQLPGEQVGVWLSATELQKLATLRFPKRREEWLLGRWAAKSLARTLPGYRRYPLSEIEVRNSPDGSPQLWLADGTPSPDCLSISHRQAHALAGMALDPGFKIGVDLETIEQHSDEFVEDYLTSSERRLLDSYPLEARDVVSTLIWSTKESMLKALQVGLRWDTRQVEVVQVGSLEPARPQGGGWQRIAVREPKPASRCWAAWWQRRDDLLMTVAGMAAGAAELEAVEFLHK
jgi:4'-phosphopantetheinyl transferase